MFRTIIEFLLISLLLSGCGGATANLNNDDNNDPEDNSDNVNSEKLIGTPLEGMTTGDNLGWSDFRSGDYITDTVDEVPIPVFLAFFTEAEEEIIETGITFANNAVGFTVFETTDTWQNDVRLIYKVNAIGDEESGFGEEYFSENPGVTLSNFLTYAGKLYAANVVRDWIIEVTDDGVDQWTIAHELGHAMGIDHYLINYEEDTIEELESDSLMSGDVFPDNPLFTDYNYMMQMQGNILLDHLGDASAAQLMNITK